MLIYFGVEIRKVKLSVLIRPLCGMIKQKIKVIKMEIHQKNITQI